MRTRVTAIAFENKTQSTDGKRVGVRLSSAVALIVSSIFSSAPPTANASSDVSPLSLEGRGTESEAHEAAIDIPAGTLAEALNSLAKQTGADLVYRPDQVAGIKTRGVKGEFTTAEAIDRLLEGTQLQVSTSSGGAYLISTPKTTASVREGRSVEDEENDKLRIAQIEGIRSEERDSSDEPSSLQQAASVDGSSKEENSALAQFEMKGMPEVLVQGSRSLNMDIRRSKDDPQPYVIFDRMLIEQSGATNIEDFLKQRLTMNSVGRTNAQSAYNQTARSQINLRGLGAAQTLILIDGRRMASATFNGRPEQPDINGIPLSAVERIEVLPTTASGIYGGSATGGVVNIILRRDYHGVEAKATYENSFDLAAGQRRLDLNGGFQLEDGRTSVLLAASGSKQAPLTVGERDNIYQRSVRQKLNRDSQVLFPIFSETAPFPSPPAGATTNIRSNSIEGDVLQNLTLKDGTPLNSPYTFVPLGYSGVSGDGGQAFVANAGRYNFNLNNTSQSGKLALLGESTVGSLFATVRRDFTRKVQAFLEGGASKNEARFSQNPFFSTTYTLEADAPTNPFQQAIRVRVPAPPGLEGEANSHDDNHRLAGGLIVRLPAGWLTEADYTWSRSSWRYEYPGFVLGEDSAVTDGTLDVLRDTNAFPLDLSPYQLPTNRSLIPQRATLKDATLRFSGPLGGWLGGKVMLSGLIERREETLAASESIGFGFTSLIPERSQSVNSAYLEARVPLISSSQTLELQVAGRWDDYSTDSGFTQTEPLVRTRNDISSTNPTLALRYQPLPDVALRASYGTGFLPPMVNQLVQVGPFGPYDLSIRDPQRGNEPVVASYLDGGNADLMPEESESWSAGLILTPRFLPDLRLSVDWTRIDKTDNIASPGFDGVVANESLFPARVTRGANLPGDLAGWPGPITQIDLSLMNISRARVEAYDIQVDYSIHTARAGTFDILAISTWQSGYQTQLLPSLPLLERVGIGSENPLKFKGNVGVTWRHRNLTFGWIGRYFHSYLTADPAGSVFEQNAVLLQGNGGRVPSQFYHDLFVQYRFGDMPRALRSTEVNLGIKNVLNTDPPFDANPFNAQYYSYYGDPRLASFYLSLKVAF